MITPAMSRTIGIVLILAPPEKPLLPDYAVIAWVGSMSARRNTGFAS
jgi:hypothetical protein